MILLARRNLISLLSLSSSITSITSRGNRQPILLATMSTIHPSAADNASADPTAKFWNKMAEGYFKSPIKDEEAYHKKLEVTQRYMNKNSEVLEFGCGTGGTALKHSPHVKHILATDISSKMIEIAQRQADEAKVTNVDFQTTSIDNLSIPNSSLDVVLGLSILHLVDDRKKVMEQTYQWLKPGGVFVASTVCINDMSVAPLVKMGAPVGRFFGVFPPTLSLLTRDELVKDFRDVGFDIDYEWRPENKKSGKPDNNAAVFIVGKKPE